MIRNPINVASRVSPDLSSLIENRVNSSEPGQNITLGTNHDFVTGLLTEAFTETEQLHHFDINESDSVFTFKHFDLISDLRYL